MRNAFIIYFSLFCLIGCKKLSGTNNSKTNKTKSIEELCEEYTKLQDGSDAQRDWLQKNLKSWCNGDLAVCALRNHSINEEKFDKMKEDYWGDKKEIPTNISWNKIESFINGMDCEKQYVGFEIKGDTIENLKKLNSFTINETCYSVPFFRAIKLINNLGGNDEFEFILGKNEKGDPRVIFSIKNTYYYDLSLDPMLTLNSYLEKK